MKMFRKEEGFTLVELMVVVLIIGILVAIAIPVFNSAKASAQKKSCFANQRTIEGSVQQYLASTDGSVVGDLDGNVVAGHPLVGSAAYIKEVPKCATATAAEPYVLAAGTTDCPATADNHGPYK